MPPVRVDKASQNPSPNSHSLKQNRQPIRTISVAVSSAERKHNTS